MRCKVLRSGSSGNCTLIENKNSNILIDAGFSQKRIIELLQETHISPLSISAILATHCHADHLNYSTLQICRKYNIPVWVNESNIPVLHTLYKKTLLEKCSIQTFSNQYFTIGNISIQPFEVSHDAAGKTFGFSIRGNESDDPIVTYAADLGCFPDSLLPYFLGSKLIILEANHDIDLLWKNPLRPIVHKKRVTGDYGHLSNIQSADALTRIFKNSTSIPNHVVLCHLSEDHNSPELAHTTVRQILENEGYITNLIVAHRKESTPYIEL